MLVCGATKNICAVGCTGGPELGNTDLNPSLTHACIHTPRHHAVLKVPHCRPTECCVDKMPPTPTVEGDKRQLVPLNPVHKGEDKHTEIGE